MKRMRVTVRLLESVHACGRARTAFAAHFPRGVTITDDQETNFARLRDVVWTWAPGTPSPEGQLCDDLYWLVMDSGLFDGYAWADGVHLDWSIADTGHLYTWCAVLAGAVESLR